MKKALFLICAVAFNKYALAQNIQNNPKSNHGNKFEQLGTILNDPNEYRTASGAPGPKYWQQRADYDIKVSLDEANKIIRGSEKITYFNNSPNPLSYIWVQLDENEHNPTSDNNSFDGSEVNSPTTEGTIDRLMIKEKLKGLGVNIDSVTNILNKPLKYTINQTMMRIDLPKALAAGAKTEIKIKWWYKMSERNKTGGRGGYEYFPADSNCTFTVTQWYPRVCVYSDFQGWQNHQFTGRGEFALTFGKFKVQMTVPADHVIGSTGVCKNLNQVLSATELERWKKAQTSKEPVEIVNLAEAKQKEKNKSNPKTKTWIYEADSVRDFAWISSRKLIWDAMAVEVEKKKTMAMSYYPKEAYGLYRRYSTKTIAHTIKTYSKFTIPYPYPVAISVEASSGMEYPMICFNFGRTETDGTYTESTKYGMLGVIIHEVGHNFFPMIVNSDERQWSWMDEGLNTFVQYLTEQEFDNNYPSSRGPAYKIVDYMKLPKEQLEPIMTNSENINDFGSNAYHKPTAALNILRETVMGRELFDYAFKEYSRRWAFKHPTPNDFFRTMEDASGVDLDWFWRGWFFDIDPVDVVIDTVKYYRPKKATELSSRVDTITPRQPKPEFEYISKIRNKESGMVFLVDADTSLRDFYYYYKKDPNEKPEKIIRKASDAMDLMNDSLFNLYKDKYIYEIKFKNKGGLVTPIIIEWTFTDGSKEQEKISAYVWRKNENQVIKTFVKNKEVKSIKLDPNKETADIDETNNIWPKTTMQPSNLELFKSKQGRARGQSTGKNPMQKSKEK